MAMKLGMRMMMMERMTKPGRKSEYAGDDGRRMIGFERDMEHMRRDGYPESRRGYMPRNEEYSYGGYPEMRLNEYPSQMRSGNSYGDIYAHGTIWAPNAMNKPSTSMHEEGGASMDVDEHKARDWVKRMSGGEHFKPEQAEQQRAAICPNCDRWEFYAAINAMYSDYGKTAQKMGLDRPDFYAMLARDFLMDEDAKPHKLARYMHEIAK